MKRRALAAAALLLSSHPAWAIGSEKTLGTTAYPVSAGGEIIGCELEFTHLAQDFAYKRGGLILLNGSVATRLNNQGDPILTFKLVLDDVEGWGDTLKTTPSTPADASLLSKDGNGNHKSEILSVAGDGPGSILKVYPLIDPSSDGVLDSIFYDHRLNVAFNRSEGGTDIRISVDLDAQREGHGPSVPEFVSCFSTYLDILLEKHPSLASE